MSRTLILGLALALGLTATANARPAALTVEGERFVLTLPDGKRLTSTELVGAELSTEAGQVIRIDAVTPSKERPGLLLHSFSAKDPATGAWAPICDKDAFGRQAGFPVAGRWTADGRYVRDARRWFLTCTSGSQGKCVLWGYDPWAKGPKGEDLAPYYRACQYTVRANYDGRGEAHTKNGTEIDVADIIGVQTADSLTDPAFTFEAGWGPAGAVCVAQTRWPDLISLTDLLKATPRLGGTCDEAAARQRGALIFTRVKKR